MREKRKKVKEIFIAGETLRLLGYQLKKEFWDKRRPIIVMVADYKKETGPDEVISLKLPFSAGESGSFLITSEKNPDSVFLAPFVFQSMRADGIFRSSEFKKFRKAFELIELRARLEFCLWFLSGLASYIASLKRRDCDWLTFEAVKSLMKLLEKLGGGGLRDFELAKLCLSNSKAREVWREQKAEKIASTENGWHGITWENIKEIGEGIFRQLYDALQQTVMHSPPNSSLFFHFSIESAMSCIRRAELEFVADFLKQNLPNLVKRISSLNLAVVCFRTLKKLLKQMPENKAVNVSVKNIEEVLKNIKIEKGE